MFTLFTRLHAIALIFALCSPVQAQNDRNHVEASQRLHIQSGNASQIYRGLGLVDLRAKLLGEARNALTAEDVGWTRTELKATSSIVLIPTSANVPGAFGSFFRTRLSLYNPTPYAYPVSVSLFGEGGLVSKKTYQVSADSGFTWLNFLSDFFGYSGAGALLFDSQSPAGGSPTFRFSVRSEVYNLSSSGTFSTIVPSIELAPGSNPPQSTQGYFAMNIGINVNDLRRTNVGCVNSSSSSAEVFCVLLSSSGANLQELTFSMPPFSWKQLPINAQVSNGVVAWGSLNPITAYMVEVDNTSNDGSYFEAAGFENLF